MLTNTEKELCLDPNLSFENIKDSPTTLFSESLSSLSSLDSLSSLTPLKFTSKNALEIHSKIHPPMCQQSGSKLNSSPNQKKISIIPSSSETLKFKCPPLSHYQSGSTPLILHASACSDQTPTFPVIPKKHYLDEVNGLETHDLSDCFCPLDSSTTFSSCPWSQLPSYGTSSITETFETHTCSSHALSYHPFLVEGFQDLKTEISNPISTTLYNESMELKPFNHHWLNEITNDSLSLHDLSPVSFPTNFNSESHRKPPFLYCLENLTPTSPTLSSTHSTLSLPSFSVASEKADPIPPVSKSVSKFNPKKSKKKQNNKLKSNRSSSQLLNQTSHSLKPCKVKGTKSNCLTFESSSSTVSFDKANPPLSDVKVIETIPSASHSTKVSLNLNIQSKSSSNSIDADEFKSLTKNSASPSSLSELHLNSESNIQEAVHDSSQGANLFSASTHTPLTTLTPTYCPISQPPFFSYAVSCISSPVCLPTLSSSSLAPDSHTVSDSSLPTTLLPPPSSTPASFTSLHGSIHPSYPYLPHPTFTCVPSSFLPNVTKAMKLAFIHMPSSSFSFLGSIDPSSSSIPPPSLDPTPHSPTSSSPSTLQTPPLSSTTCTPTSSSCFIRSEVSSPSPLSRCSSTDEKRTEVDLGKESKTDLLSSAKDTRMKLQSTLRKGKQKRIDRRFSCQICGQSFKRSEHLKRHLRVHTGERPFLCPIVGCLKSFSRTDNLTQHLKIHSKPIPNLASISSSEQPIYPAPTFVPPGMVLSWIPVLSPAPSNLPSEPLPSSLASVTSLHLTSKKSKEKLL